MRRVLCATFTGERAEQEVLAATRAAREAGLPIHDVYTPYAVHGMDEAMGLRPSRLTFVCLAFGILGLITASWFQHWVNTQAWELNIGGKPYNAVPAFIPVAFEVTVLFAAIGTVIALFLRAGLLPRMTPRVHIPGVTDDRFALVLATGEGFHEGDARRLCDAHGAHEIALLEVP